MSAKIKIKKLEQEIEDLKKQVNNMIIDINDPEYAIYKEHFWDSKWNTLSAIMDLKKPVNETAVKYEIEKLFNYIDEGLIIKYKDIENKYEIPEYKFLKEIKVEKNKRIYSKDPDLIIYKESWFFTSIDNKFIPFNKPAREFDEEYDIQKHVEQALQRMKNEKSNSR